MKLMDFTVLALKNLFSKPATKNYPAEPAVYPERSRGHIEIDIDDCIMCGMCQRKCPSSAITVDRATKTWTIDRMGCVQCENCVSGCPKKCLHIKPGYTEPSQTFTVDSYSKPVEEKAETNNNDNSDTQALTSGKITNDMTKCILCGLCARNCPAECITVDREAKTWTINRDDCAQCGACIDACKKFKSLSYAEDDGETGMVVFSKDGSAPAPKSAPKKAEPKKEEVKPADDAVIGKLSKEKPDSNLTYGKIANDIENCILCGLCARACPKDIITVDRKDTKTWTINRDECLQCGECIEACKKFHCLGYAVDDAEYGLVTYKKEA